MSVEIRIRERRDGLLKLTRYECVRLPNGKRRRTLITPEGGRARELFDLFDAVNGLHKKPRPGRWPRRTDGKHGGGV